MYFETAFESEPLLELGRRLIAEAIGTGFLIVGVVGSGIMASRLSPTDVGLQLLENAAATGGALIGLILMFGAVSGAHFNPIVTMVERLFGTLSSKDLCSLFDCANDWWLRWCDDRQHHVRTSSCSVFDSHPIFRCTVALRTCCHRWSAARYPRLRAKRPINGGAVRRRGLDYWGPLVYLIDEFR